MNATASTFCHHGQNADDCKDCKANVAEYERLNSTAKAAPRGSWKKETWRGTSNGNDRGNTTQRRKRREWLMKTWECDVPGFVRCYRCGIKLHEDVLTIDRIVPGCQGGKYEPGNIRPCCSRCNSLTGGTTRSDS